MQVFIKNDKILADLNKDKKHQKVIEKTSNKEISKYIIQILLFIMKKIKTLEYKAII